MSAPLVATKLYVPLPGPRIVSRPRLIVKLNEGLHRKLTLISAPAGFGKTTLVSAWIAGCGRPAAWLSLGESESDLASFLTYLAAALQTIDPKLGAGMLSLLRLPQPLAADLLLPPLVNEIAATSQPFVLVLDDYHLVDAQAVDAALAFLVEHQPPQLHLVITTREDPQLPLPRLRARGQLTEVRAADLRFTAAEAAEFLNPVMGLRLSTADIAALEERTEGWIAGLQMTALSLQGRTDSARFVRDFTGSHHFIIDYLVEEVLQRQPERIRSFLLQTSILERLNSPLCAAVTGQEESSEILRALERANLFVVALDDQRHWYRYHHLFADVLHAHLAQEQPDRLPELHQRASQWCAQNDLPAAAIRHALSGGDYARAADLVELAVHAMRRSRQEAALLAWMKAIPDELIRARPVLSVGYALALLAQGMLEGVEERLRDAERWLDGPADSAHPAAAMVVGDEEQLRRLPGTISVLRAGIALSLGDVERTVYYARRALDLVPEDDHLMRGAAGALLGLASWTHGDLEAAYRTYADGMVYVQRAGNISDAIGCALALADIRMVQGRLAEAVSICERGLQLALVPGEPALRGAADMCVGLSSLQRERNELDAAMQHVLRGKEPGEFTGLPQNPYRWRVALARIREAQGDLDGALDLLDEAEHLYVSDFFPNVRPVAALKTRVWVAQARLGEALGWVQEQGLSVADDLAYMREFEHITLARVLLARCRLDGSARAMLEVVGFLDRLLHAAQAGGRTGSVIEILVLAALAQQAQGDLLAAIPLLRRALALAEPQGYVRMFVDEGPPMAALLQAAAQQGIAPGYICRLLQALDRTEEITHLQSASPAQRSPASAPGTPAVEPLSEREIEVLRLLATELSGPEIARTLFVSLNTMRTHTHNIYQKLGVNSRRAVVRRAEELNLL